jgi:hypothetical protein
MRIGHAHKIHEERHGEDRSAAAHETEGESDKRARSES